MSIPGSGSPLLLATTAAAADAGYVIPKSLRFNSGDSSNLSKTFATAGNRRTWTWSAWVKRGPSSSTQTLFKAGETYIQYYSSTNTLYTNLRGGATNYFINYANVFRDPSAWYHIVVAVDTTQATSSNRQKVYVNGVQLTDAGSLGLNYPAQNHETGVNNNAIHYIGGTNYFDGLMADVQFVDGQALAPTDFGETRSSDGVWVPKEYTGTYDGYDQSQTWSTSGTLSGFPTSGTYDFAHLFNGEYVTTQAPGTDNLMTSPSGGSGTWTYTISNVTEFKIRLYVPGSSHATANSVKINGSDIVQSQILDAGLSNDAWHTVTVPNISTFTSLFVEDNYWYVSNIYINGRELVDPSVSKGKNGFHLNFSDSSTNEALGFDSAPTIPDLDPKKGMDVITYTGNGGTQNIGGLNFEPGLVWIKERSGTGASSANHVLVDSVRGVTKTLYSNTTSAETTGTAAFRSFNPDGFTLGLDTTKQRSNDNNDNYVAWTWRAGGPAVANTNGTITSQVSASTEYGFSVVKYTGTGSNATVGHSLGKAPAWILVKTLDDAYNWFVYHKGVDASAEDYYLRLNTDGARVDSSAAWNDTAPTSTLFSIGTDGSVNESGDDYIAYCWSEVSGYSKFSSYSGSGASGNKQTLGFKPRWVIIKCTTTSANEWVIFDTERNPSNPADDYLYADKSAAEASYSNRKIEVLDDGFQFYGSDQAINTSGDTYIYAAFADRPGNNWDVNNIVTNEGLTTSKTQFDVLTYTGNGGTQKIGGPVFSASAASSITNPGNIFDGSTSTGGYSSSSGTDLTLTTSSFTISTQLRVYNNFRSDGTYAICLNGTCVTVAGSGTNSTQYRWSTVDLSGFTLPLTVTSLGYSASQASGNTIRAVEVDSSILLDGTEPGLKFQPDLVWIKSRTAADNHSLFDSVRGAPIGSHPNLTNAEFNDSSTLTAFNSDGFTLAGHAVTNANNQNYVAWCWKAGGTAVSNTDGSITSSVSANAAYGFSIATYTGTGSGTQSVGHGLSSVPALVITKSRGATGSWRVFADIGGTYKIGNLNNTDAFANASVSAPTSSVFNVDGNSNASTTHVAYCFANISGYQRVGVYTGNGSSTGPVIVTGFKPRLVMTKCTSTDNNYTFWEVVDSERPNNLAWDLADAEGSYNLGTGQGMSFLSNGFQITSAGSGKNINGETYIYLAIGDDEIGSDEDCLVDVPNAVTADADATDTTGGYQRGNYAVLNPLDTKLVHSNGNLDATASTSQTWTTGRANIGITSGKFYWEVTVNGVSHTDQNTIQIGISALTASLPANDAYQDSNSFVYANYTGYKASGGSESSYGDSYGVGDTVGVAYDADNGTLEFYVNGVSQGDAYTSLDATKNYAPVITLGRSSTNTSISANFGQMRFKYPMPSGYAALNTTALPAATIPDGSAQFETKLYTGNGSSQSITGLEFSPDFVWIKSRTTSGLHNYLLDTVRGATKRLISNQTFAEATVSQSLTAFNSDGFSVGSEQSVNKSSDAFVAFSWDAGSSTVSNTDGGRTASVRANQSAGFSICAYSGGGGTSSFGHGLSAAPEFVIVKNRTQAGQHWVIYHKSIGADQFLKFTTDAKVDYPLWQDNHPTSSIVYLGNDDSTNKSGEDYIAYCFAPVAGYSAFGSYTGTGSATNSPFVYLGFRARFILFKNTTAGQNWRIMDTARNTFNVVDNILYPNLSNAEQSSAVGLDILSNGFKIKESGSELNDSGDEIIYAAFAENPFQANGGLAR